MSYKINIKIAPTCFGVLTPFGGSLKVVPSKVMNYWLAQFVSSLIML